MQSRLALTTEEGPRTQVMEQKSRSSARTLSYEGATTIGSNIMPDAAKLFAAMTGATFNSIGGAGADAGFKAAIEGRATFGGVARELTAEEKKKVGSAEVIGYDVMGVFVHAGNPVASLTRAQLKQIFTGQTSNWNQFGGPDRPITVYSERLSGGRATVKAFKDLVLSGENYGPVKELDDAMDCLKDVTHDPGGITASSMSFAMPGVKALAVDGTMANVKSVQDGIYPLKRPLVLVTKDPPAGDVKAFLDFMLTPEAQAIVGRKFIPAR
jgi:phosphate transport system substrate-binding protein